MHKNLLRYVFADSTAVLADNYFFVFLAVAGAQSGATPAQIGLLLTVYAIPRLVLLLPGGVVADRVSARIVMTVGNAAQAIAMALLAVSLMTGDISILGLFIAAAFFGTVDAFNLPSVTAAPVHLVAKDKLFRANRLRDGVGSTFQTIGFFAPGVAVTLLGLAPTAWIGAGLYVVSAVLFSTVRFTMPVQQSNAEAKLMQGIVYVWRARSIRANILLQAIANFATAGPLIVGLLLLVEAGTFSPILYSVILVAYSIGGIAGAFISSRFELTTRKGLILLLEIPLVAIVFVCMATIPSVAVLCIGFMMLGGYSIITGIISDTWRQHETTHALQGRVGSVKVFVNELMKSSSRAITGGVVMIAGLNGMFWIAAGVIMTAAVLIAATHRQQLIDRSSVSG